MVDSMPIHEILNQIQTIKKQVCKLENPDNDTSPSKDYRLAALLNLETAMHELESLEWMSTPLNEIVKV